MPHCVRIVGKNKLFWAEVKRVKGRHPERYGLTEEQANALRDELAPIAEKCGVGLEVIEHGWAF